MNRGNEPISFGEALIANSNAMDVYLRLPRHRQEEIVNNAVNIMTSEEMQAYVDSIAIK